MDRHIKRTYFIILLFVHLESWERLDLSVFQLVNCGIHLGYDNVSIVLELLSQLVVDGSQLLAVAAPRRIKFDQNIFGFVVYNFVKVGRYQDLKKNNAS